MGVAAVGAAAAAVSAGVGLASSLSGGAKQSSAVSSGQQQADADQQAALTSYTANAQPFISTGTDALTQEANLDGLNGTDAENTAISQFQASPGYQYQVQQGLSAIDNGAASTGTLRSGNTIRAEETLGSNLANQDFSNYYNRLTGLATGGSNTTNALGSAEVSTGAGEASTATSGATAQANIAGNEAKGVGNALTGLANNSSVQNVVTNALSGPTGFDAAVNS